MGVSREQAAENRRAIVAAATQLFRERGVEAVGLNELMKHAGFTQGGFYNHFESKAALVAEVLAAAMAEGVAELTKSARAPVDESTTALRRYISFYLSQAHRDSIDHALSLDLQEMLPAWAPEHSRISPAVWTIR